MLIESYSVRNDLLKVDFIESLYEILKQKTIDYQLLQNSIYTCTNMFMKNMPFEQVLLFMSI